ncbi:FAD/NAD(P)-binding protein [Algoriphagus vanfongensis]|uniref:FAD/NAD(P)-binding protein n=1 Tax=Algoriphagus vanfongensis TaxID=426371 RepID=UPI00040594C0|nr:FAD/NAD(P)-binding protein [Algoriphagus vanfongensis]
MISKMEIKLRIAIVGFGPKGLYGLERLLAHYRHLDLDQQVEIHLFNKTSNFATGDNYDPNQPAYLLMNYENSKISMWPTYSVSPIVSHPQTYEEWLQTHSEFCSDTDISPRAKVGEYLLDGFDQLLDSCPVSINLSYHQGEVIDIRQTDKTYSISYRNKDGYPLEVENIDNLLITTGHPWGKSNSKHESATSIHEIYPVEQCLQPVKSGSQVLIKGMGLTFIDAVLALTEGRGGTFDVQDGQWRYLASGHEPLRITPFSRSGLVPFPKSPGARESELILHYCTSEKLREIQAENLKISFESTVLPFLEQEYKWQYYAVLFSTCGEHLSYHEDFEAVQWQIDQFHERHPQLNKFDLIRFLKEPFVSEGEVKSQFELLSIYLRESAKGIGNSALATVAALWRRLAFDFGVLYRFGGLDPESHRLFDTQFFGAFNRVSYGPPVINLKKLQAIAECGILDLTRGWDEDKNSACNTGEALEKQCEWMIHAQVPRYEIASCPGELYGNMIQNGLIVPFQNSDSLGNTYSPGCPWINHQGHPINPNEEVNSQITFMGTPTEGITLDNDTLSRDKNDFLDDWAKNVCDQLKMMDGIPTESISVNATSLL